MPAFQTSGNGTVIEQGQSLALVNNAATDSGITQTIQFVPRQPGTGDTTPIVFVNTTNQTATIYLAPQGATATPMSFSSYASSNYTVPNGQSLPFNLAECWVCCVFATAPTSGSLTVQR